MADEKQVQKSRKAILDKNNILIAVEEKTELGTDDIDAGDLPADGSYQFCDGCFIPKGYGKGKPEAPKVDKDEAFYLLAKATINEQPIPQEVQDYLTWYETYVRRV